MDQVRFRQVTGVARIPARCAPGVRPALLLCVLSAHGHESAGFHTGRSGLEASGPCDKRRRERIQVVRCGVGRQLQQWQRQLEQREQQEQCPSCSPRKIITPVFSKENIREAYLDCRKNKRNKPDALRFELNAEEFLEELRIELSERTYHPSTSICFVVAKPKFREIFAADFRDRIVHHLVVRYLEAIWEPVFIHDTHATRKGRGIHLAAKRLQQFTRKITNNNTKQAYYLKIDIRNFFMSIDKDILFSLIRNRCRNEEILWLAETIVFHEPQKDYLRKSPVRRMYKVPLQKSLFGVEKNKGIPIGNLTSQFFGNVYLNGLDQYVKHCLKCKYYLRYVDDMVLLAEDTETLRRWMKNIEAYLKENLELELNPARTVLRPIRNGCDFLGYVVRPNYMLCRKRVVNNLKERLKNFRELLIDGKEGLIII